MAMQPQRDAPVDKDQRAERNVEAEDELRAGRSAGSMTPGQATEGEIQRRQERSDSEPRDRVGEASDESFPASDPPSW